MIVAFQAINQVKVVIRLEAGDWKGTADVGATATAYRLAPADGDLSPLASVRVNLLSTNLQTAEAAVIHLLYLLDAQLASGAFAETIKG